MPESEANAGRQKDHIYRYKEYYLIILINLFLSGISFDRGSHIKANRGINIDRGIIGLLFFINPC
ncbi:hypothetical protein MUTS10_49860 [Escherichia coli]|nr:hypothetical protein BvCmsSINP020_1710 [Escherichia coli]BDY73281.1 hypothetical protein MUTS9_18630 [Escherichia coli]BDY81654.1 hypothetical protein MUTS10_49860 [Escherichia coli]BDY86680.1 hypothetical protein MUTS11_49960 [Escherichia coli]